MIGRFAITLIIIFSLVLADELKKKNTETAKKLSFFPGAGQVYNGEYLKGLILFASEAYSVYQVVNFSKPVEGIINVAKRNSFIWWALGIYVYSIIDAHVESELSSFPDKDNLFTSKGE